MLASDEKIATSARFRVTGHAEVTAAITDADDRRLQALTDAGLVVHAA